MENNFTIDDKDKKMKFCPHCGFPLSDCFTFCPNCGKSLNANGEQQNNSAAMLPAKKQSGSNNSQKQATNGSKQQSKKTAKEIYVPDSDIPHYLKAQLIYGEKVVYKCSVHWKVWIPACFWFALMAGLYFPAKQEPTWFWVIMGPALIIFIIYFLKAYIEHYSTCLAVTNKRVICKYGFIRRETYEINLDKVEGVNLTQSIMGRIIDCSSVQVSGAGSMKAPVKNIINANDFKQALLSEREKEKSRNENKNPMDD